MARTPALNVMFAPAHKTAIAVKFFEILVR